MFRLAKKFGFWLLVSLLLPAGLTSLVMGQSAVESWSQPLNLSQSGGAGRPQWVVDSTGRMHLFWLDQFAGPFYSQGDGHNWSEPVAIGLPSGDSLPFLLADSSGRVHAFWLADQTLFYSNVPAGQLATPESWSQAVGLMSDVIQLDGQSDSSGGLHLSLIRAGKNEAGLYYLQSADGGLSWAAAQNLYPSAYFRLVSAGHSQIRQIGANQWLIVWDSPQGQVWAVRGNGQVWQSPQPIDQRQANDSGSSLSPRQIMVSVAGNTVHLSWQAGHGNVVCQQYHQWSDDGGQSWRPAEPIFSYNEDCSNPAHLLTANGTPYLVVGDNLNSYLMGWQAGLWSPTQLQPELTTVSDEQSRQPVVLNCGQDMVVVGEMVWVAACGQGVVGQDIWVMGRSLTTLPQTTPIWQTPAPFEQAEGGGQWFNAVVVTDGQNELYIFGSQAAEADPAGSAIYYSRWNNQIWSSPLPVLRSPEGKADQPSVMIDRQNKLLAVWRGGESGQIYFSEARLEAPATWADPVALPMPRPAGSHPTLGIDPAGTIVVVYALPFNEGRGLYLTRSADGGQNWLPAVQIFDGVAAGWEQVDQPQLVQAGPGQWHLLWQEGSLPFSQAPTRLFYARSEDNGQHWSEPALVSPTETAPSSVSNSWLVGLSQRELHRAWQEWNGSQLSFKHQYSLDGGLSWQNSSTYVTFAGDIAAAHLVADPAGQLHLLLLGQSNLSLAADQLLLQHWTWQGEQWQRKEDLMIWASFGRPDGTLAAAITADGQLQLVYGVAQQLFATGRVVALPLVSPTPLPPLTPTPTPSPGPSPLPTSQATPTHAFSTAPDSGPRLNLSGVNGIVTGAVLALVPAGAIVLVVVAFAARPGRDKGRAR